MGNINRAKSAFKLFKKFIVYKLKSRHRKGFRIHSPFLFALVNKGFREECSTSVKKGAAKYSEELKKINTAISRSNFGAGSLLYAGNKMEAPAAINQSIGMPKKHGELLHKLSKYYGSTGILELGTGLGSSAYYLATGAPTAKVVTVEGHKEYSETAKKILSQVGIENIEYRIGSFINEIETLKQEKARFGMFFIDGDHSYAPTLEHFNRCLQLATDNAVIVIDDIHWSDEMDKAWNAIKEHPECRVSVDLFRFGLVFTNKKLQQQHYLVRY